MANLAESRAKSVFVGNIPYEATEENLRDIFSQAGPIVNFRIMFDRESGKPKGFGFCEYADIETAQSAIRNLNNYDYHGRPLRVGPATGQAEREDRGAIGHVEESPYGEPVETSKAPEAISRAVASLPPEQMFELMKQMKLCIQNNPNEARNMLLQNPQLAYALLQAQIIMKIVEPTVAMAMLHRQPEEIPPISRQEASGSGASQSATQPRQPVAPQQPARQQPSTQLQQPPLHPSGSAAPQQQHRSEGLLGQRPVRPPLLDNSTLAPRPAGPSIGGGGAKPDGSLLGARPRIPPPSTQQQQRPGAVGVDSRGGFPRHGGPSASQHSGPSSATVAGASTKAAPDSEKAQLIMQVLQLTDEQIALLPPEQRKSILILKEQISKSTGSGGAMK